MAASKNIILVTGGNAGIGLEIARQLLAEESKIVIIGSRSIEKGNAAVKKLNELGLPGSVDVVQLDVDSPDSIEASAKEVEARYGKLDVVVNNAGIAYNYDNVPQFQFMADTYRTNVIGPHLVVEAFAPLLRKSTSTARIVNVGTGGGSISGILNPPPGLAKFLPPTRTTTYNCSKAALNMLTAEQSVFYGKEGFKVFVVSPGFTESTLGPFNKVENGAKPVAEGAKIIVDVVKGERDAEHGGYLHGDEVYHEKRGNGQYGW